MHPFTRLATVARGTLASAAIAATVVATPAVASRPAAPAEAAAIRAAALQKVGPSASVTVRPIRVASVDPRYAAVKLRSPGLDTASGILRKVSGRWRMLTYGTSLDCRQIPLRVARDLGPAYCVPPEELDPAAFAAKAIRARGYEPLKVALNRVAIDPFAAVVGTRSVTTGTIQRAFFFVRGRFVGTDTSAPSGQISVIRQAGTHVTVQYALYRPEDPLSTPSGGTANVRYALCAGRIVPLDAIPTNDPAAPLSRR